MTKAAIPATTTPAYTSLGFTPVGCAPDFDVEDVFAAVTDPVVAAALEPVLEAAAVPTVETTLAGAILDVALAALDWKALMPIEGLEGLDMLAPLPISECEQAYGLITPTMPDWQCIA